MKRLVQVLALTGLVAALVGPLPHGASAEPVQQAEPVGSAASLQLALFDPNTGEWHLRSPDGTVNRFFYGNPGDVPLLGDWDCDGLETVAMFRPSNGFIYLRNSNTQGVAEEDFFFGIGGDIPLAGDWNGDGCDTFSIYRPSESKVYVSNQLGTRAADFSFYFGIPGDRPFAGDFNGDGITTAGLYREQTGFVYFRDSLTTGVADFEFFYGVPSDRIVAGDWDGDGDDSVGIFRPGESRYYLSLENRQGFADIEVGFGAGDWLPVAGDFLATLGDRQVQLPTGGHVEVEPEALPPGTRIEVEHVGSPALPPGTLSVGDGFRLTVDAPLSIPAAIRLPLPAGASPERLIIYRMEPGGGFALLHTEVSNGELLAYTPGFSVFGVLETIFEQGGPEPPPAIEGPAELEVEALGMYWVKGRREGIRLTVAPDSAEYFSSSGLMQVKPARTGFVFITASSDDSWGYRSLAVRKIRVREGAEGSYRLQLHANPSVSTAGAPVNDPVCIYLTARLQGTSGPAPELSVEVKYEDGPTLTGSVAPKSGLFGYAYSTDCGFEHTYAEPGTYNVTVTASAPVFPPGGMQTRVIEFPLTIRPMEVHLEPCKDVSGECFSHGATTVVPVDQPIRFRASPSGGTSPYTYTFKRSLDEIQTVTQNREVTYTFDEPGTYFVDVKVADNSSPGRNAEARRLVTVTGPGIIIDELDGPAVARVGQEIGILGCVEGGELVAFGRQHPYRVEFDWGDRRVDRQEVFADDPAVGACFGSTHTYTGPGTYLVSVTAATPSLSVAENWLEVEVVAPDAGTRIWVLTGRPQGPVEKDWNLPEFCTICVNKAVMSPDGTYRREGYEPRNRKDPSSPAKWSFVYTMNFTVPPDVLYPGEILPLTMTGTASGFVELTSGGSRHESYYLGGTASAPIPVEFPTTYLFLAFNHGNPPEDITSGKTTVKYTIPPATKDAKLTITINALNYTNLTWTYTAG